MGAICGIVTSDPARAEAIGIRMLNRLQIYPFDRAAGEFRADDGVYLVCGLTYNTPESRLERLPRKDRSSRFILTADAIIDNRSELLETLQIGSSDAPSITDSELILMAYEKWGYACPKYLIGDYAFAIWDTAKKELYCARDPVGMRTLYYAHSQETFAFCTIEKPLLEVAATAGELNEKWMADFLAIDGIQHEITYEETVYKDICQLPPAHYRIVNSSGVKQVRYWDPLKDVEPIRFESDEQYVEAFNRIFSEAVSCRLRSSGETAIMLSGGMDSGAIACVAAEQMEANGNHLHAYCSIPSESFHEEARKGLIYNEAREVECLVDKYANIRLNYCRFEGSHAFAYIDDLLDIFEQPYKVFRNMTWYYPILKEAAANGCTIMLNGQSGNNTISYGSFNVHLLTLFRSGKWTAFLEEIHALSKLLNIPAKKVYKHAFRVVRPYRIRRWQDRIRNRGFDRFRHIVVNRSLIDKWRVEERLDRAGANLLTMKYYDYEEERELRAGLMPLTHIAAIETKLSLASRITIRDPSRDKRVLAFCLNIPSKQFVNGGVERYLLRRAMKGILPDPIRNNMSTRGVQSADWIHRLRSHRGQIASELDQVLAHAELGQYIDMDKVKQLRQKLDVSLDNSDEKVVIMVMTSIIVHRFILSFHNEVKA